MFGGDAMSDNMRRFTHAFVYPTLVIGTNPKTRGLVKTKAIFKALGDESYVLSPTEEQNRVKPLSEGDKVSVSVLNQMDLHVVNNGNITKNQKIHEGFEVPYYDGFSNVCFFEVADVSEVQNHKVYGLNLKESHINDKTSKIADTIGLLEDEDNYYNITWHKSKHKRAFKNEPYHYKFKYKICELKSKGWSYKELADKFDIYHETIEEWYTLYRVFGKEGLTKTKAKELSVSKFTKPQKKALAKEIINQTRTYRQIMEDEGVSMSRLRYWVKQARRGTL